MQNCPLRFMARKGQFKKDGTAEEASASRAATCGQPPATAGMIETPAPAGVAVSRPCSKRTSSSFT